MYAFVLRHPTHFASIDGFFRGFADESCKISGPVCDYMFIENDDDALIGLIQHQVHHVYITQQRDVHTGVGRERKRERERESVCV